jgi:hypothetical protein
MEKWNEDKFTDPLTATVRDAGPEPVEATRARLQGLIDDATKRDDTYLVKLYGEKLAALPQE